MQKENEEKTKKPFYKRFWFWFVVVILVAAVGGHSGSKDDDSSSKSDSPKTSQTSKKHTTKKSNVPLEYQNCLDAANNYLSTQAFSKKGLRDQLKSKDGDNYPTSAVNYAMSHIKVNWNEQAYKAAKDYQDNHLGGSRKEMMSQLTSSYGDGFTKSQAEYAVNKLYNK